MHIVIYRYRGRGQAARREGIYVCIYKETREAASEYMNIYIRRQT